MRTAGNGVEKRQFGRRQTYLHGWVAIPGRGRMPCVVRDISVGGALLQFNEPPAGIPFCFKLTIESTRFVTACEIRHNREPLLVGVEFVPMELLKASDKRNAADSTEDWLGVGTGFAAAGAGRLPDGGRR